MDSVVCRTQADLQRGKQPRAGICIDEGRRFARLVQRVRVTQELIAGGSAAWMRHEYDTLGRPYRETDASGGTVERA